MVLVALGGYHLVDGLVVVSVEARKKLMRCSREELCKRHYAHPAGAAKNNSSKVRHEGRQVGLSFSWNIEIAFHFNAELNFGN